MCQSKLTRLICKLIGCCGGAEGNSRAPGNRKGSAVWWFFGVVYLLTILLVLPILRSGDGISTPGNLLRMAAITWLPSLVGILFIYLTRDSMGQAGLLAAHAALAA